MRRSPILIAPAFFSMPNPNQRVQPPQLTKPMITIRKRIEQYTEINLSASEVADLFWEMDECHQAEFFNSLGFRSRLPVQLLSVTHCDILDEDGRRAMRLIGQYASK